MYDAGVREVRTLKFRLYGVGGSATAISAQKLQVRKLAKLWLATSESNYTTSCSQVLIEEIVYKNKNHFPIVVLRPSA